MYKDPVGFGVTPGTVIAGYEIERSLGRGGMGDVYLARKDGANRRVALKLLNMDLAADTRFRTRFERESHMATDLEHPNIVPVYETGEVDRVRYIVMRYVDGPTLRDLVDTESPLEPRRVLALLDQVASALDAAHEIGLVHRDVKPANVLVARGGASEYREHAYLTDFGVSKYASSASEFTGTGQFVGTSLYAAPEQIKGEKVDGRTDVYSFGALLYECLTGRPPYDRETEVALMWAHMMDAPPSVSEQRGDLPLGIDDVVARAMAKSQDDRFASAGEVVLAARSALAGFVGPSPSSSAKVVDEPNRPPAPPTVLQPLDSEAEPVRAAETLLSASVEAAAAPAALADETVLAPPDPVSAEVGGTQIDEAGPVAPVETATVVVAKATDARVTPDAEATEAAIPETTVAPGDANGGAAAAETVVHATEETVLPVSQPTVVLPRNEDSRPPRSGARPPVSTPGWRRWPVLAVAGMAILLGAGVIGVLAITGDDDGDANGPGSGPVNREPPTIAGTARVGDVLTAAPGTWSGSASFAYRWRRCDAAGTACRPVAAAKTRRYRLTPRDLGRRLRVSVTATGDGVRRTALSAPTTTVGSAPKPPSITARPRLRGTALVGATLTVTPGDWSGSTPTSVVRKWHRCEPRTAEGELFCTQIIGVRGTTYTARAADTGRTIRVLEVASNGWGTARQFSNSIGPVARPRVPDPDPPTPDPDPPKPDPDPPEPR